MVFLRYLFEVIENQDVILVQPLGLIMMKKFIVFSLLTVACGVQADIGPQPLDAKQFKDLQDESAKSEGFANIKKHVANFNAKKLTPEQLKKLQELSAQSEEVIKIQRHVNEMRIQARIVMEAFAEEGDDAKIAGAITDVLLKMETIFNKDANTEGLMTEGLCVTENEASRIRFIQGTQARICVERILMAHYLALYEQSLQEFVDSIV